MKTNMTLWKIANFYMEGVELLVASLITFCLVIWLLRWPLTAGSIIYLLAKI